MIDIHSHILSEIDDGSSSIEESIAIIKKAIENGYTGIFLTPHYRESQGFIADNREKYKKFKKLQAEISKLNLPIKIYLGNEITVDEDFFYNLNTGQTVSLNGSRYVLLELPFLNKYEKIDEVIDRLVRKGNVPIIAHPERYFYYKDLNEYERLIKKGVLFQGNIGSLYGKYGLAAKETLEEMLKRNMIHFMASDIHKESQTSYDRANNAKQIVAQLTRSKQIADNLFENNAKKIIADQEIEVYSTYKKKYKLKLFKELKSQE